MKAVIQRVTQASVSVDGKQVASIGAGILTLLGFAADDDEKTLNKLIDKIITLRIFPDSEGKINYSLRDKGYAHLIVPQFTLLAACDAGRRPSFTNAANPSHAKIWFEQAVLYSQAQGVTTAGGVFQANMQVQLINDGPMTFLL